MARPLRSLSALGTIRREIKELSRGGGTPPLTSRTQNYVVVWLLERSEFGAGALRRVGSAAG